MFLRRLAADELHLRERRQELEHELETLCEEAAAYKAETVRDDPAREARLQKRRDALEESIRRARTLLHDSPITDAESVG